MRESPLHLLDAKKLIRLIKITEKQQRYNTATVRGGKPRLQSVATKPNRCRH